MSDLSYDNKLLREHLLHQLGLDCFLILFVFPSVFSKKVDIKYNKVSTLWQKHLFLTEASLHPTLWQILDKIVLTDIILFCVEENNTIQTF